MEWKKEEDLQALHERQDSNKHLSGQSSLFQNPTFNYKINASMKKLYDIFLKRFFYLLKYLL